MNSSGNMERGLTRRNKVALIIGFLVMIALFVALIVQRNSKNSVTGIKQVRAIENGVTAHVT